MDGNRQKLVKTRVQFEGGITSVLLSKIAWLIAIVKLRSALSIDFLPSCHCNDKMLAEEKKFSSGLSSGINKLTLKRRK